MRGAASNRGFTVGSPSKTSSPAAWREPDSSASARASSSTTGPRAVLISTAVGFMRASSAAPMRWRVDAVSGTWRLTMSDRSSSSSSVADETGHAGVVPCRMDDPHVETLGPLGDRTGNAPEADEPKSRSVHVTGEVGAESPARPAALSQVALCSRGEARGGEDQEERQICRRVIEHAGGVADCDAHRVRRDDIDVVVSHGSVRHHAQPSASSGLEHRRIDAIGEMADDAVALGGRPDQLVWRQRGSVLVQHHDLMAGLEQRICPAFGQGAGDEDAGHLVRRVVDGARALDPDGEAEAVDRGVVADRAQRVHLVRRDVHQIAL